MHYELQGCQSPDAPTILLSSGLGGAGSFWAPQLDALARTHRVLIYDHLGTGQSPAALPAGYRIEDMAREALALLDRLEIDQVDVMGHALGGLVGLQMALMAPARLNRLIVINAWSCLDVQSARCFHVRRALLRDSGVEAYLHAQPLFLYPADWLSNHHTQLLAEEAHALAHFPGKDNVMARIEALSVFDIDARLGDIVTPTLVIASRDDLLVPYMRSQRLAEGLPNARQVMFDYGGHGLTVTVPDAFNTLITQYLADDTALIPLTGVAS
ncbi:pyrimidine utilization protein D [Larsenimonas rhizosphaerae]|uniref:pyrimidine utilization protein D n=1 Tax=Larsenimonas rhizosphaerae TaxID=2944682 RepID=UPI002033615F|nr:pyrimidine utilization protein D [Larsenimonas rhizosphaerae]MCM2129453.1 pyrimidine utilization protein D [Larsenimonas rhizosphaerae]